jgi:hypothetical protein
MNKITYTKNAIILITALFISFTSFSQVTLEKEVKITDLGLHFDGSKVASNATNKGDSAPYDFFFGRNISAHGDCIKTYENYVFMTWYRGGKSDRHVMLTRYNTTTGTMATIEFPHRHTGYQNRYWIGESHNTIAVGVSPLDGTIHLLYDMHAYSSSRPSDGSLADDYFRYSYSVANAASLSDEQFTLDKFVENDNGGYKHLRLTGTVSQSEFIALTYPQFFLNDLGDLFMYMREGGNNNGMYKFSKYNATTGTWGNFVDFNSLNARNQPGITYNWGLYGDIKYVNGKIRIGFQRRSQNNDDKYQYQNGIYYAYSDNQDGVGGWKNYKGESFTTPLFDADLIKVIEPGDYVATTQKDKVHIVGSFDWTVTENEDVHIISRVKDNQFNKTKYLHTYKPSDSKEFITTEKSTAGSFYTSGSNVYVVGLSNGRVFVDKALGGTDDFERVYTATTGRRYDHGVVHINNGKAYYYLMEDKSGNAQPLYLQIIDLDIDTSPFRISLKSPNEGDVFGLDKTIEIAANAFNSEGAISKVVFTINDLVINEDVSAPYSTNWETTEEGTYRIKAIAYDENDNTKSSSERTISVRIKDPLDLSGEFYRLRNVETGKYLKASSTESSLSLSNYIEDSDELKFQFVSTTLNGKVYYSIDPKTKGVLRATGSNFSTKYAVVTSGREPPNADSDKVWTAHFDEKDNAYRFEARDSGRFLYSELDESLSNNLAETGDNRSKWILESGVLSVKDNNLVLPSINVFPNPTNGDFAIILKGFNNAKIIINDLLGKIVYERITSEANLLIENNGNFKPGLYLVRVIGNHKNVLNTKLIVK